jgi:putative PEP-CTERM system histidine kinase
LNVNALPTAASWSYGVAVAAYLAFALRVALGWRRSARAGLLLGAMLVTAIWAAAGLAVVTWWSPGAWLAASTADAVRYAIWFAFLATLLQGSSNKLAGDARKPIPGYAIVVVTIGLLASVVLSDSLPLSRMLGPQGQRAEFGVRVVLAVFALMLVEQLFRRAHPQVRWGIKPLCVALAGTFGFDLFLFADALLFGRLDPDIWVARGAANALVIPFIAVATARNTGWTIEMHLSREAVFHSTALMVSGLFLLVVAVAGYVIRYTGGDWARALQIELFFGALLVVVLVASSGRFRSRLKVFVSKHFFSYRYDYREEWLRFTRTLSTESSMHTVHERVIMALANLVESPAGALWLIQDGRGYQPAGRWNMAASNAVEPEDGSLSRFLRRTGWVVSVADHLQSPEQYPGFVLPAWMQSIPDAWLVVPLASGNEMLGFVVLATPRAAVEVNWEVRDMLKTASRQAASFLGQLKATEALLETRKFDAFNRMSAFVVHDLKNLVAQLSLMLKNAERHRDNPEFQRDMLLTVEHVVGRMNKLMLQLRTGATPVENPRLLDLEPVVRRVCAAKTTSLGLIDLQLGSGITAIGHEDRLEHVIGHLLQNAIDATSVGGSVRVSLDRDGASAVIQVVDNGVGMSPEFVRERLFKPFETTKAAGMGIGVYESAQYVSGLGGQILFDSSPESGTRVRVLLPLGDNSAAARTSDKVIA